MNALQFADLLAQGSFGGGFGAGIGAGIAIGIGAGSGNAKKKLERQLTAAMEAGEISVVDQDGQSMTAESIPRLLHEQVRYSHTNGDGWSEPIGVGEESSLPAIAVGTGGVVHLAWTQDEQIYYSSDSNPADDSNDSDRSVST